MRYRRPNVARHSSISWNLMIGRKPMKVAQQHGHSPVTMLSTYAACTEDMLKDDVNAIRRAMTSAPSDEPHNSADEIRRSIGTRRAPPTGETSLPTAQS